MIHHEKHTSVRNIVLQIYLGKNSFVLLWCQFITVRLQNSSELTLSDAQTLICIIILECLQEKFFNYVNLRKSECRWGWYLTSKPWYVNTGIEIENCMRIDKVNRCTMFGYPPQLPQPPPFILQDFLFLQDFCKINKSYKRSRKITM